MEIVSLLFYIFAFFIVVSSLVVISIKNPVHSVLFLILAFFNSAGLFILLGAEFIATLMVIVYVGAVAVLFLFVVMMINIDFAKLKSGFVKNLPLALVIAAILFTELFMIINSPLMPAEAGGNVSGLTNTEKLGKVLYTNYFISFQVAGLVLLVALIAAIVLTHRKREGVRKQNISSQISRKKSVKLVKVETGKGVM